MRWFWTLENFKEPTPENSPCFVCRPPYKFPMGLIAGDHMNGVMMLSARMFEEPADADKCRL